MRLRNIPGADEAIACSPFCIQKPDAYRGIWNSIFNNQNEIHIEIGMGKGRFICQLAQENPSVNYIGIEKYTSVLLRATQKLALIDPPNNLRLICMNAEDITNVFSASEVSKIYLNFSDPWPKDRHAKRRLTSNAYLQRYEQILAKHGVIEFKTDNLDLFNYSLGEISDRIWHMHAYTYDLHHDEDLNQNNIMTEYEEKFSSYGNPICKYIISKQ